MSDGINEMHGLHEVLKLGATGWHDGQRVTLTEYPGLVGLDLSTSHHPAGLTPAQARYLARKLYRLARRVEAQSP